MTDSPPCSQSVPLQPCACDHRWHPDRIPSVMKLMGVTGMIKLITVFLMVTSGATLAKAQSLQIPATEDIPEEILQTEMILEARSPLDGKPLSAAEYAQLQAALSPEVEDIPAHLSPKLHRLVVLLKLRKLLSTVVPFLF